MLWLSLADMLLWFPPLLLLLLLLLLPGIVRVAQVDTFGDIIPPRTLSPKRDGAFGWLPREGE